MTPEDTRIKEIYEALRRPFDWADIEVMPKRVFSKEGKEPVAMALAYFDARAVMQRLDDVLGFENWTTTEPTYSFVDKVAFCQVKLTVTLPGGKTVERWGESELTDIEQIKGGASSALKRCFSALANRTLYDVDLGWQPCTLTNDGKFKAWTPQALVNMREKYERSVNKIAGVRQND